MKLGIEQFKKVTAELGSAKVDQMIADERRALEPKAPPPKPAPAATPPVPKVTTTSEEKVGTKVRQSPLLGEAMKRRLKELLSEQEALAHELVALERTVKKQASQAERDRAEAKKLKQELSAKEASAKRAVGEKAELAKENANLKAELKTLSLQLNNVEKERDEAWQEVRDIHEAAAGGVHKLFHDIEGRLAAYAEQRAANPSMTLMHMILADEHLDVNLRNVLREIL